MEGETRDEPVKDLNELENADWVRIILVLYTMLHLNPDHILVTTELPCVFLHDINHFLDVFPKGTLLGASDARST